jgi:roadblock/LC7 domain-containing protein
MADINHDQRMRLDEIRTAHEDRLSVLRLQAAREGRNTSPEVITEIRQIEKDLRLANGIDDASETMLELLGRFAQRRATDSLVLDIQADLRDMQKSMRQLWYTLLGFMVAVALVMVYVAGRVGVF